MVLLISSLRPHHGCRTDRHFIAITIKQILIKWIFCFRQLHRGRQLESGLSSCQEKHLASSLSPPTLQVQGQSPGTVMIVRSKFLVQRARKNLERFLFNDNRIQFAQHNLIALSYSYLLRNFLLFLLLFLCIELQKASLSLPSSPHHLLSLSITHYLSLSPN